MSDAIREKFDRWCELSFPYGMRSKEGLYTAWQACAVQYEKELAELRAQVARMQDSLEGWRTVDETMRDQLNGR